MKDLDLEEMKNRLKNQEKERQSELLQLQMEVSEQLHRVSSSDFNADRKANMNEAK